MEGSAKSSRHSLLMVLGVGVLLPAALYLTSRYSYLLFHSLAELFSIVIACGVFIVAWHTRRFSQNRYLLFLGIAYLFTGFLDLLHTLAYQGMGVFPINDADLPTQLWIAARYLETASLLLAPLVMDRTIRARFVLALFALVTAGLLAVIFLNLFPVCYVEGVGLSSFKKVSEYLITALLLVAIVLLYRKRRNFNASIFAMLVASIVTTMAAEITFTFYISVSGLSNFIGHIFKLISFYLIYICIIRTALKKPYRLLFRDLKNHELELQKALREVKKMSGLLPICSSCKKIRDDKGYWNMIEQYIEDRSEVEFSHGLCPECARKLYQDLEEGG